ncbi:MAG: hypothetical protein AAF228_04450 [Pseudomonadota bacterium]
MPRLNAPSILTFLISLVLATLALIDFMQPGTLFYYLPSIGHQPFWLAITAYVVLMVGNLVRGL